MKHVLVTMVLLSLCAAEKALTSGNMALPSNRASTFDAHVSFSAGLTSSVHLAANETVIYNKVFNDARDSYDNVTGVFTCPRAGIYSFIFHGFSGTGRYINLDLVKNGDYEVTGYGHLSGDYGTAGNSILLSLAVGDTVFIRSRDESHVYGQTSEIYNTFTGFIVLATNGPTTSQPIG